MLEFRDVTFRYEEDTFDMLKKLCFFVEKGAFISIIGASGCGKSTIFRLINGLEKIGSGQIFINGAAIEQKKCCSAYMPQKDLLFPWRTIEKNLCLPMEIQGVNKTEMKQKCDKMLSEVGLSEYSNKFPKELSGGMRQRASFARTLLTGSELLLLDEPFSALDSLTKINLQEWLLKQWEHFGKTILFITHDVEEAIFLSQKIFIIQDRPITMFEEVEIPMGYPRQRGFLQESDIVKLKEELISKLRQKVML